MDAPASSKSKHGNKPRTEKVAKSEIELGLPFMVPDIEYKSQMICLRGTQVIEQKPNVGRLVFNVGFSFNVYKIKCISIKLTG
jgi:hypothetical protein